jgi:hypothetical protein
VPNFDGQIENEQYAAKNQGDEQWQLRQWKPIELGLSGTTKTQNQMKRDRHEREQGYDELPPTDFGWAGGPFRVSHRSGSSGRSTNHDPAPISL